MSNEYPMLSAELQKAILVAVRKAASYNPDRAMQYITGFDWEDNAATRSFLQWCFINRKTFDGANILNVYNMFLQAEIPNG